MTIVNGSNPIDAAYERMNNEMNAELAKGERMNVDSLYSLASRITAYGDRHSVRNDHNHVHDRAVRIKALVERIRDSYNDKTSKALNIVAVIISALAAGAAFAPLGVGHVPGLTDVVGRTLASASQAGMGLSQGFTSLGGFADKQQEGLRKILENEQNTHERSRQNREQASGQSGQQARQAIDHEREGEAARNRATQAVF